VQPRQRRRHLVLAALVAATTLFCLSCGSKPARGPSEPLLILTDRDLEGLDPHLTGDVFQTDQLLANVYEGLVWRDQDMALVPGLATSWWNPDDLTWEFQLRPDVAFHTGGTMTAADVVFSLDRARTRGRFRVTLASIAEVTALAGNRVRIRTRSPDASLVSRLWKAWIVSRTWVEKEGEEALSRGDAGTGPYRVVRRRPGLDVELEAVPSHWRGTPAFPQVRFLARGQTDTDVPRDGRPLVFWSQPGTPAFDAARREYQAHLRPGLSVTSLAFDLRHPNPFLDPRVRKAVSLAIDRTRLAAETFAGESVPMGQLVSPVVFGFDPELPAPRPDLAEARRLLAQTEYRDGFEVVLEVRQLMERYAAPLARDLAEIGIRVSPRVWSEEEFFPHIQGGLTTLTLLRYSCRTGDAQEFLDKWVHSRDEVLGYGAGNTSYDENPVPGLDAEIDRARAAMVPQVRLVQLRAAMRRATDEHLLVPLVCEKDVLMASRSLAVRPRADGLRIAWDMRPAR